MGCVVVELVELSLYVSSHSTSYGRCIWYWLSTTSPIIYHGVLISNSLINITLTVLLEYMKTDRVAIEENCWGLCLTSTYFGYTRRFIDDSRNHRWFTKFTKLSPCRTFLLYGECMNNSKQQCATAIYRIVTCL